MPSAPARRAASRSQTLSPTTQAAAGSTPISAAAARNRSGSGLAWRTISRVTIGASSASPSIGCASRAISARPLVAIAQGTPLARSRQGPHGAELGEVLGRVILLQRFDIRRGQGTAGLPQQRRYEKAAAHSDPAVNPPDGKVDIQPRQRGPP